MAEETTTTYDTAYEQTSKKAKEIKTAFERALTKHPLSGIMWAALFGVAGFYFLESMAYFLTLVSEAAMTQVNAVGYLSPYVWYIWTMTNGALGIALALLIMFFYFTGWGLFYIRRTKRYIVSYGLIGLAIYFFLNGFFYFLLGWINNKIYFECIHGKGYFPTYVAPDLANLGNPAAQYCVTRVHTTLAINIALAALLLFASALLYRYARDFITLMNFADRSGAEEIELPVDAKKPDPSKSGVNFKLPSAKNKKNGKNN